MYYKKFRNNIIHHMFILEKNKQFKTNYSTYNKHKK